MKQHRTLVWIFFGIILLSLNACKKDKDPVDHNLELKVNLKYGAQDFRINTIYTDPVGMRIQLEKIRFYLSRISLLKADGSSVEVKSAALLDASDAESLVLKLNAPAGVYTGIRMGLGVDSLQNNADPTLLPSGDPLTASDMYWTWLKYIFFKVEGRSDTTTNASGNLDWLLVYHIGTDQAYRTRTFTKTLELAESEISSCNFQIDLQKVFYGDAQTIDIRTESFSHSEPSAIGTSYKMADNFAAAISLMP